jgi:hypothetical protein
MNFKPIALGKRNKRVVGNRRRAVIEEQGAVGDIRDLGGAT